MKWLIYFWLLLTILGATVMGCFEKPTPRVTSFEMICLNGVCESKGDVAGLPPMPQVNVIEQSSQPNEYTIPEAIAERSFQ